MKYIICFIYIISNVLESIEGTTFDLTHNGKKFEISTNLLVEFNVYNGKMLEAVGVVNYNKYRILEAQKVIPKIDLILNNPKQFWRGY